MLRGLCKSLLAFACLMAISLPAAADCTLGHKSCRKGQLWVCERCGSETCWIFKGTRCVKNDDESSLPGRADSAPLLRQTLAAERSGERRSLYPRW